MPQKQKLSFLSAIVLPLFALAAFFLFSPAKASATYCPNGEVFSACQNNPTGCGTGAGGCVMSGFTGIFGFCKANYVTYVGPSGPGTCNDQCVTCTYGVY